MDMNEIKEDLKALESNLRIFKHLIKSSNRQMSIDALRYFNLEMIKAKKEANLYNIILKQNNQMKKMFHQIKQLKDTSGNK